MKNMCWGVNVISFDPITEDLLEFVLGILLENTGHK